MTRLPVAMTSAMVVAAVSLALMVICWNLGWPDPIRLVSVVHCSAVLCLTWSAAGLMLRARGGEVGPRPLVRDLQAVLQMASIVTGLFAVVVMVYAATTEVLIRTPYLSGYESPWQVMVWPTGFLDLAFLAGAVILAWARTREPQLVTLCFWVLVLAGLWLSLQVNPLAYVSTERGWSYLETTRWAVPFIIFSAAVMVAFALGEGYRHHHRRVRAWPHALQNLTAERAPWPGFHYSFGIVSVVLMLGACIHILSPWAAMSAFAAGGAALALAGRRWDENLADVGFGLMTLGIVSLCLVWLPVPRRPSAGHFASIFAVAVVGLAISTAFWHWLARVWDQQLDHGRAWTTAGRLIPSARRVGFLAGAIGVTVSAELAFWPKLPAVTGLDHPSIWGWVWGLGAQVLLALGLWASAWITHKTTLGWLLLFSVAAMGAFVLVRAGDSLIARAWVLYWPLIVPLVGVVALVLSRWAADTKRWRFMVEPFLLTGLIIAPLAGLAGIWLVERRALASWLPAAVFAALTGAYLVAVVLSRLKGCVLPALLCAALAVLSAVFRG
ncbi:MAG: hypothetical protein KA354_11650 [Phycisphaerae bacterium]|nr:hypothetical protein [Phycisphaerae bacterium]